MGHWSAASIYKHHLVLNRCLCITWRLYNTLVTLLSINQVGAGEKKTLHVEKLAITKIVVVNEPPHFTKGISGASNNITIALVTLNDMRTATARSRNKLHSSHTHI